MIWTLSPGDLGDWLKVSLECARGSPGNEKCKAPSTVLKWQETLKCNYFPFLPVPQRKSTENGTRKSDLELVVWISASPTSGRGWALKPSKSPRGPGARGGEVLAAGDHGPDARSRVPGPTRAVPHLPLLTPQAVPPTQSLRLPCPSMELSPPVPLTA